MLTSVSLAHPSSQFFRAPLVAQSAPAPSSGSPLSSISLGASAPQASSDRASFPTGDVAALSTGEKVAIGVGLAASLAGVGWVVLRARSKKR